ncbi:hypothetical protein ABTM19_19665, partial [Acinetobacter baumannii]
KKNNDVVILQLKKAFEEKELDFIVSDLGLDKEDKKSADKYFTLTITKVGLVNKAELNEELFSAVYPNKDIKTEDDFKAAVKAEIESFYAAQS